jgi:hypothetical protein
MRSPNEWVGSRALRLALGASVLLGVLVLTTARVGRRDSPESAVIGGLRAVISAQHEYASHNDTYCGTLECLAVPAPGRQTPYVSPDVRAWLARRGYLLEFYAGPREGGPRSGSPGVRDFAVVAVPVGPDRAARRAFCADAGSVIYVTHGTAPRVEAGRCVERANTLQ